MVLNFFNLIFWIFISTCYCIIYIRLAPSGAGSTWKEKQTRTIRWKSTQEISALQERAGGKEKPSHFKTVDTQRFKMLHRKCSAYELRRRQSGPARECTSYADDLRPIHALSNFSKFSQNVYIIVHNLLQILIATKGNHLYHPHTASYGLHIKRGTLCCLGRLPSWSPNSTVLHLDIYLLSWWWGALWACGIGCS